MVEGFSGVSIPNGAYRAKKMLAFYGICYHPLENFPGVLFNENGYLIFPNESEYLNNPYLQHEKDIHVSDGISSLTSWK